MGLNNFRTEQLIWDRVNSHIAYSLETNSGDSNGRKLRVQILDGGVVTALAGVTLSLAWKTGNEKNSGLDAFKVVDAALGIFEIYYTTEMLSNIGKLRASLVLVDSTGRMESDTFPIVVKPTLVDDNAVQGENSFTALTEALVNISNVKEQLAQNKQEIAAKTSDLDSGKIDKNGSGQVNWANIDQKAREIMLGEKPMPVVGDNSVLTSNLTDNVVTYNKAEFFKVGKNHFNKRDVTKGYRVSNVTGALFAVSNVSTSGFIDVLPNDIWYRNYKEAYAIFDENSNIIEGGTSISTNSTIVIPSNGRKIRITVKDTLLDAFQFEKGSIETPYAPYKNKMSDEVDLDIKKEELPKVDEGMTSFFENLVISKNLLSQKLAYKHSSIVVIWNESTNSWNVTVPSLELWNYFTIKVITKRNTFYNLHQELSTISGSESFYSTRVTNMSWIPGTSLTGQTLLNTSSRDTIFNSGDNDFVYVNFYPYNAGVYEIKNPQVEIGQTFKNFVKYTEQLVIPAKYIEPTSGDVQVGIPYDSNYWNSKKAAFNGDSITQGYLSGGDPYPNKVGRKLNMEINNQAIGGGTILADEYPNLLDKNDGNRLEGRYILSDGTFVSDVNYDFSGYMDVSAYPSTNHANIFLISPSMLPKGIKSYALYDANKKLISAHGATNVAYQTPYPYIMHNTSVKFVRMAYPSKVSDVEIRYTHRYPIIWRYQCMPDDADLIYMAGGTNDSGGYPLGTFEDRTPFTFYGALHLLAQGLQNKYVGKTIVFATPIIRYNIGSQVPYVDAIIRVANHYGIPVLDMYRTSNLNHNHPLQLEQLFGNDGGGHPNDAGHEVMARRATGFFKQLA